MDIRIKIIYLLVISVGIFFIPDLRIISGLFLFQLGLWPLTGIKLRKLVRTLRAFLVLCLLIIASFVIFPGNLPEDSYYVFTLLGTELKIDLTSLQEGTLMALRILTIIIVSILIRAGSAPGEFMKGLKSLWFPEFLALTVDTSLGLIDFSEKKPGSGKNKKARKDRTNGTSFRQFLRRENNPIIGLVNQSLERSRNYAERAGYEGKSEKFYDAATVSGLAALMMTIRFLKIMPKIPVAPGHKGLVIIPLYVLGAELTATPFGATYLGITIGIISFLFGEGRFGIFEIFKYITAGLTVDFLYPIIKGMKKEPGVVLFSILGIAIAIARFSTIVAVALIIGVPAGFFALMTPVGIVHLFFGALSGPVSYLLVKSVQKDPYKRERDTTDPKS